MPRDAASALRHKRRMSSERETLVARLTELVAASGKSERQVSMEATGKPDAIRFIKSRNVMPSAQRLSSIASVLHTTTDYLLGKSDAPHILSVRALRIALAEQKAAKLREEAAQDSDPLERIPAVNPQLWPKDIPVFGSAIGSSLTYEQDGRIKTSVEQTDLNRAEVIDTLRRPPALAGRTKVYGLYVAGTSMEPAFESGTIVLVDPTRPPSIRDYVVVYVSDPNVTELDEERAASVLLKRLARRTGSYLELEQFNPPATFRVDAQQVQQIHRILPWTEIIGI